MDFPEAASRNGEAGSPLSVWKSRRAVLRAGFGCILALLVFSTIEAYRIQGSVSEQRLEVYRRHAEREEALVQLRRNVMLASTYVRDFFMSAQPDRAEVYRSPLSEMHAENATAVEALHGLQAAGGGGASARLVFDNYWRIMEPIPETMAHVSPGAAYDFVQREVVPRRSTAYWALRQLSDFYRQEMMDRDMELARGRKASAQRLAVLLGVCIVLGLLVAWLTLRHAEGLARQASLHYDEVMRAKREAQRLSARLMDIQEEERRRLSRGLHDEIGQTLTALRIEVSNALSKAESPDVRERLERARALAERTVSTVRDISLLLRPSLLDDLGLGPALQWQVEDFTRRSGIACEFHEAELPDSLPDAVKTCVYRVVQEALNNCEKHARASKVWVTLRLEPNCLVAEVRDNGCGFETEPDGAARRHDGIGLVGMRERAALVGGTLTVATAPGRGTRVRLEAPLAKAAPMRQASEAAVGG
jgi:signal transduction histidine kinase